MHPNQASFTWGHGAGAHTCDQAPKLRLMQQEIAYWMRQTGHGVMACNTTMPFLGTGRSQAGCRPCLIDMWQPLRADRGFCPPAQLRRALWPGLREACAPTRRVVEVGPSLRPLIEAGPNFYDPRLMEAATALSQALAERPG